MGNDHQDLYEVLETLSNVASHPAAHSGGLLRHFEQPLSASLPADVVRPALALLEEAAGTRDLGDRAELLYEALAEIGRALVDHAGLDPARVSALTDYETVNMILERDQHINSLSGRYGAGERFDEL